MTAELACAVCRGVIDTSPNNVGNETSLRTHHADDGTYRVHLGCYEAHKRRLMLDYGVDEPLVPETPTRTLEVAELAVLQGRRIL